MRSAVRILVPGCSRRIGAHGYQLVGDKYLDAVRVAGGLPLVVAAARPDEFDALLELADGVLLTGSPSNVHPRHFDETVRDATLPLDPARDDWVLPLLPRLIQRGIPLLAICRGFQELNVALGGSLHQAVHAVVGMTDHRSREAEPIERQYGPAHPVQVIPGGRLAALLGAGQPEFLVNSLHGQGIHRLGAGLRVEARAPDGLVEAFSVADAPGFTLAVQWHPEWQAAGNPISMTLFGAFGTACQDYRDRHRPPSAC